MNDSLDISEKRKFLSSKSDDLKGDDDSETTSPIKSRWFTFWKKFSGERQKRCEMWKKCCSKSDVIQVEIPIHEAFLLADKGDAEGLEHFLISYPAAINMADDYGKTLMHRAAENGHSQTIEMLIGKGCTAMSAADSDGNTPLHIAAMRDRLAAVIALIGYWTSTGQNKVGFCAKNEGLETPMHLAVRHGSAASLECLLNACPCPASVNSPGWHGETPLHVASCTNHVECAKLLIAHGADPLCATFSGMKPIHNAARRSSLDMIEFLLTSSGVPKETMLAAVDDELQTALHWAVNNGDRATVALLLQHGAKLDAKMYDQSTALHLACSQGLICVVNKMYDILPEFFKVVMEEKDAQGMTSIHRSCMFNRRCCLVFLLDKGAAINDQDNEGRTPLVLAASRSSWDCKTELLRAGADPSISDACGRNFLHYMIAQGGSPDFEDGILKFLSTSSRLLDQKDSMGCTPLHYAAQNGSLRSSSGLMKLGASISVKDKQHQSPLHFAARGRYRKFEVDAVLLRHHVSPKTCRYLLAYYGRFNTAKRLLEGAQFFNLINDTDKDGMAALHLAAENGHTKVVQLLMSRGALFHRDCSGRTPLHVAAANNYRETIDVIVVHFAHLVNNVDKEGNTALHYAATNNASAAITYLLSAGAAVVANNAGQLPIDIVIRRKHTEAAIAMVLHERWEEILTEPSAVYGSPVSGLIEHLPDVMITALDRCVVRSGCHPLSRHHFIHFDYKLLEPKSTNVDPSSELLEHSGNGPLIALNAMVRHQRCDLLSHPVCSSYLNKKWATYGVYFHGVHVAVYATFLALLTYCVCTGVNMTLVPHLKKESYENILKHASEGTVFENATEDDWQELKRSDVSPNAAAILIASFAIANMIKEVYQMIRQRWMYWTSLVNYMEWTLYVSATVYVLGYYDDAGSFISWRTRFQYGACAVFFAWFTFMLYLQRFGLMGIYVVMFLGILKTLLRALFVFLLLLIAFGLAFHVLLPMTVYPDDPSFYAEPGLKLDVRGLGTPHLTLLTSGLRITGMMLGDLDGINNYINPLTNKMLPFPGMTYVILVAFVVIVSILLMNLLIGLAVGDIEKIQCNATLQRIGMQVELHTILERRFPKWMQKLTTITEDKYYPNRSAGLFRKLWFITKDPAESMKDQTSEIGALPPSKLKAELHKQHVKMRELQTKVDQQYDLLRLIVQKMEIHEEADELDEGVKPRDGRIKGTNMMAAMKRAKWAAGNVQTKVKIVAAFGKRVSK